MRRVLIGFFGMIRRLDAVIDSIEQNIFAPLEQAGIEFDVAGHFNCPRVVHSPRSGEFMLPYETPDLSRLRLSHVIQEEQTDETAALGIEQVMRIPQKHEADEDGLMRRNATYQIYSLHRLHALMEDRFAMDDYDAILLLRPDLRYLDPLPVAAIDRELHQPYRSLSERARLQVQRGLRPSSDIVLPGWHKWGGVNDRFAMATPAAARTYMSRLRMLPDFIADNSHFQSELLLHYVLKRARLRIGEMDARAERVRADGHVEQRDITRVERRPVWRRVSAGRGKEAAKHIAA
jgi:SAM-dependent methyltransferase